MLPSFSVIPDPVAHQAQIRPQAVAYRTESEVFTWQTVAGWVRQVCGVLQEMGVSTGDRVALYAPASVEYLVVLLALMRLGAIAAPLNTRYPRTGLDGFLRLIQAKTLLTASDLAHLKCLPSTPHEGNFAVLTSLSLAAPVTLVFTSGSSGEPKAALHSLANHYFSAQGSAANLPLSPSDTWHLTLPLFHVSGLGVFFRCLFAGATLQLAPEASAETTHVSWVAAQLQWALENPPLTLPRAILLGGSAMPADAISEAYQRKLPIFVSYGMTEMASQISTTRPNASLQALQTTAGYVLPHRVLRLAEDGEIWVQGETRFMGYWQEDQSLLAPFDAEGWFATKDVGQWTSDGALQVLGRKDLQFISGGENIQPEAIERLICQYKGILVCVVVPAPHPIFGWQPVAFIKGPFHAEALQAFLSTQLPRYQIPRHFLPLPPEAENGLKINRLWLGDLAKTMKEFT